MLTLTKTQTDETTASPDILCHISVEGVVFGYGEGRLHVLLSRETDLRRGISATMWKLPGQRIRAGESVEQTAMRILYGQTGAEDIFFKQFQVFSSPDPHHRVHGAERCRVVTVGFYAIVNLDGIDRDDMAPGAEWKELKETGGLMWDHREIFDTALARLRHDLHFEPVICELLPDKFTLSELQNLYEIISGSRVDKRNFRRRATTSPYLVSLSEHQTGVAHRAAGYYMFNKRLIDKTRLQQKNQQNSLSSRHLP